MAPQSTECERCLHLLERVARLEERITCLYQIREDEKVIDSFILPDSNPLNVPDAPITDPQSPGDPALEGPDLRDMSLAPSASAVPDPMPVPPDIPTCPASSAAPFGADQTDLEVRVGPATATSVIAELDDTVPWLQLAEQWNREGARPKHPRETSTPGPWTLVGRKNHMGKHSHYAQQPAPPLATSNSFAVLGDVLHPLPCKTEAPVLPQQSSVPPSVSPQLASSKRNERLNLLKSAVRRHSMRRHSGCPPPLRPAPQTNPPPLPSPPQASCPPPLRPAPQSNTILPNADNRSPSPPSTTIIIGDSIIRHVSLHNAHTVVFPGATVAVITDRIQEVSTSFPDADSLIVHVGTNDIKKQQSELLKREFIQLFGVLKHLHYRITISGPTPMLGRGLERFSRLLSLNTWLQSACLTHNLNYINNFDIFWHRDNLFAVDGLHLNLAGARALSSNLLYGIQHFTTAPTGATQPADQSTNY